MSLSCLACHGVDSPSASVRGWSGSDSDGEGRCGTTLNCWMRRSQNPPPELSNSTMNSRVAPQPGQASNVPPGSPRLVRCHAVRRDIFRDWNFHDIMGDSPRSLPRSLPIENN